MIDKYSDHAANERTFLAWVRTGIATIAFGFVVEKFNLFVRTIAEASIGNAATHVRLNQFSGSFGRYDGLALIVVGMAIIVASLIRFVRTSRLIDDRETHSAASVRAESTTMMALGVVDLLSNPWAATIVAITRMAPSRNQKPATPPTVSAMAMLITYRMPMTTRCTKLSYVASCSA